MLGVGLRVAGDLAVAGLGDESLHVELIDAERVLVAGRQPAHARTAARAPVRVARAGQPTPGAAAPAVVPAVTEPSESPDSSAAERVAFEMAPATLVQWPAGAAEAPAAALGGDEADGATQADAAVASSTPDAERVVALPPAPPVPAPAAPPAETPAIATETPADAVTTLVASPAYARLREVAQNPSVSARARSETMVGRREILEYLLDHPEFATHVTRALRLARYRVWRTDEGFFLDDGWGSTGQLSLVYAAHGTRVLYARGEFQGKLLPAIPGEALVTIEYDAQPGGDGKDRLSTAVTSQVRIEGAFGEMALQLAGAWAVEKAEKEARRLVRIVARVIRATEEAPAALYASLRERPGVPERQLEEFRALLRIP